MHKSNAVELLKTLVPLLTCPFERGLCCSRADHGEANPDTGWRGTRNPRREGGGVSGPGGVRILSPQGKHLGIIIGPEHPHNFAWGDDDGKTLYLCAQTGSLPHPIEHPWDTAAMSL